MQIPTSNSGDTTTPNAQRPTPDASPAQHPTPDTQTPTETYLAFDLGAESGRTVAGQFDGERLTLTETHRFTNEPVLAGGVLQWDVLRLFLEIKRGLSQVIEQSRQIGTEIASLSIDAWAVDFGLLGRDGNLLANPRHYRDRGNDGIPEAAFEIVPRETIYSRTGIQFLQFNTLYQLLALKAQNSPLLDIAQTLLFLPDLFHYWLTGAKITEYSMASSSQFSDPRTRGWATDLLAAFDLPTHFLPSICEAGDEIGHLTADIVSELGIAKSRPIPVIACAEHDTGSAIVAVPAESPDFAYISSGTWSLMGIETASPIINAETLAHNFTNEGGVLSTNRLLKNVMGLWLVQECRRTWAKAGQTYDYGELTRLASEAPAFVTLLDPDDRRFFAPDSMPEAIANYCRETGQPVPETPGAFVRCCLVSLALKYRQVLERLEALRGAPVETVHIVGGGSQNRLLCQFAANAMNRRVVAGPIEATAAGNVLMQMKGKGRIASLAEAREVVLRSFALETYEPEPETRAEWQTAYGDFLQRCKD